MKRVFLIPAAVVFVLIVFYVYSNYSFMFHPVTTSICAKEDKDCIKNLETNKENCIPSSTIIEGRDGIVLMVNITRKGEKCVRTETVIDSKNQESNYLIGKNITCEYELSQINNASATACPGSLYDYVLPSPGGGGNGGLIPFIPVFPKQECELADEYCKSTALDYLQECINSEIISTELRWQPDGYWTILIKVERETYTCKLYLEVLNAVNLPPGTPATIIGSNMTCQVPYSEFPIENLLASWCAGELYDYLYP